jgi:hypothetical protein
MLSSQAVFAGDVSLNLFPFLDLSFLLSVYCRLDKTRCQRVVHHFVIHREVQGGLLTKESSNRICGILDHARFYALYMDLVQINPQAAAEVRQQGTIHALRNPKYTMDYFQLNAGVYSYWEATSETPLKGLFHSLLDNYQPVWGNALMEDCRYWKHSRVTGCFYVLIDRPDGTILISEDYSKVFLALGLTKSIGELCNKSFSSKVGGWINGVAYPETPFKFHGPVLGKKVFGTLLNYENKIVSDYAFHPMEIMTTGQVKKALTAYLAAASESKIISRLEKNESKAARLEPKILSKEELAEYRNRFRLQLDFIASKPSPAGFDAKNGKSITGFPLLVYRRFGYTEEDNPEHMIFVLNGGAPVTNFYCKELAPSVDEYIQLTDQILQSGYPKPAILLVDSETDLDILQQLFREFVNMAVSFYPPPSTEERYFSDLTNPKIPHPACRVCRSPLAEDGTKLFTCSKCKGVYYCCREHQKEDWKKHKKVCR